jgi:hypothetical protein
VRFEPHVRIAGVPYDFRFYALLLLGALTAWAGVSFVRSAIQLANGNVTGWRLAVRTALATVALVGPRAPLSSRYSHGVDRGLRASTIFRRVRRRPALS